jgi:BMFP domain-containing protein YqiC
MSDELRIDMVPRELYYHEKAYVRGLEARIEELETALRTLVKYAPDDRSALTARIEALEAALRWISAKTDDRLAAEFARAALAEGQDK